MYELTIIEQILFIAILFKSILNYLPLHIFPLGTLTTIKKILLLLISPCLIEFLLFYSTSSNYFSNTYYNENNINHRPYSV